MKNALVHALYEHAQETGDEECCGLIVDDELGLRLVKAVNEAPNPFGSFTISPRLIAKHYDNIVAVYHSHPKGSSKPSLEDIASCALVNKPFLVVSWPGKELSRVLPPSHKGQVKGRQFVYGLYDCVSAVTDYYKQVMGIELPEYVRPEYGWWDGDGNHIADQYESAGFVEVEKVEMPGDVVMMGQVGKRIHHVGVYSGNGMLLHHQRNMLCSEEVYGDRLRAATRKVVRYGKG